MPKGFIKRKPEQKLGYRTADAYKRNKRWDKIRPMRIFAKSQGLRGSQHRV